MVAVPGALAVTFPVLLTVATAFLLLVQVTFLFVPETFKIFVFPVSKVKDLVLNCMAAAKAFSSFQINWADEIIRQSITIFISFDICFLNFISLSSF